MTSWRRVCESPDGLVINRPVSGASFVPTSPRASDILAPKRRVTVTHSSAPAAVHSATGQVLTLALRWPRDLVVFLRSRIEFVEADPKRAGSPVGCCRLSPSEGALLLVLLKPVRAARRGWRRRDEPLARPVASLLAWASATVGDGTLGWVDAVPLMVDDGRDPDGPRVTLRRNNYTNTDCLGERKNDRQVHGVWVNRRQTDSQIDRRTDTLTNR